MKTVLLAYAPDAQAYAAETAAQLQALGYETRPAPEGARARAAALSGAHRLVLIWSRQARRTPNLIAAARRAAASGKLACVSIDAAPAPFAAPARFPRGRARTHAWRRILDPAPSASAPATRHAPSARLRAPARVHRAPQISGGVVVMSNEGSRARAASSRLSGIAALVFSALCVSVALYLTDGAFTDWIDAQIASLRAMAGLHA